MLVLSDRLLITYGNIINSPRPLLHLIPQYVFLHSFTVSSFQTVALLLNGYSVLLLKVDATEVLVGQ